MSGLAPKTPQSRGGNAREPAVMVAEGSPRNREHEVVVRGHFPPDQCLTLLGGGVGGWGMARGLGGRLCRAESQGEGGILPTWLGGAVWEAHT